MKQQTQHSGNAVSANRKAVWILDSTRESQRNSIGEDYDCSWSLLQHFYYCSWKQQKATVIQSNSRIHEMMHSESVSELTLWVPSIHTAFLLAETSFPECWVCCFTYRNPTDFFPGPFRNATNMFSGSKFTQKLDSEEQTTFRWQGKPINEKIPKNTDNTV